MSIESELETLFVRIKVDTSQLDKGSVVRGDVDRLVNYIRNRFDNDFTVKPKFDTRGIAAGLEDFATKIRASLDMVEKEFINTDMQLGRAGSAGQNMLLSMQAAIKGVTVAAQELSGVAGGKGIKAFSQNVAELSTLTTLPLDTTKLAVFVKSIAQIANDPTNQIKTPDLTNMKIFGQGVLALAQALGNMPTGANVAQFAANLKKTLIDIKALGKVPQFAQIAADATSAGTGVGYLNTQLQRYLNLMNQIKNAVPPTMAPNLPPPPAGGAFGGGGGGGGGGSRRGGYFGSSMFGFNPVHRVLGMLTSIGTSMAVGVFGFEMFRQISDFDNQMNESMTRLHVTLQNYRATIGEDINQIFDQERLERIRATAERDVLFLARRTEADPRELAIAFGELARAGYGTDNLRQALSIVEQFSFVGSMKAADAARELTTIQRQLGLTSNDAVENARNLRYVGDTIMQASIVSNMSTEVFLQGLQRLNPHIVFLNRGLEESTALLAAFGRVEPTSALSRAQALMRAITSQFVRSTEPPGMRTSAPGTSPIGPNGRPFRAGQGVVPIHMMTDSVRVAADAWREMNIEVFNGRGEFVGVAAAIQAIDRATRHLTSENRERSLGRLFPGQLRSTATDAIKALLGNSAAMESLAMSARRADGILDQLASRRLQTFNAQLSILRSNVFVAGIGFGQVLVPVLRVINSILITLFDAWFDLGEAGQYLITVGVGLASSFTILRFILPFVLGAFKVLVYDTAASVVMFGYNLVALSVNIIMVAWAFGVLTVSAYTSAMAAFVAKSGFTTLSISGMVMYAIIVTLSVAWTILTSIWAVAAGMLNVMAIAAWLWNAALAVGTFATWLWNAALTIGAVTLHWLDINIMAAILAIAGMSIKQVLATAATLVWNLALKVLAATLTFILTITGFIIISFVLLTAVMMAGVALANMAWVALLFTLQTIAQVVIGLIALVAGGVRGDGFVNLWNGFLEATERAFWATAGFFAHFRHNMNVLMTWMEINWPNIMFNITNLGNIAWTNMFENIKIGWAKVMKEMADGLVGLLRGAMGIGLILTNPARLLLEGPGLIEDLLGRRNRLELQAARPPVPLLEGARLRAITPLLDARTRDGIFSRGSGFRLDVPEEMREIIGNMFARPRVPGAEGGPGAEVGGRFAGDFREISLKRFVLDQAPVDEDARRQELIEAQETNRILRLIADKVGVPMMNAGPSSPVVP